MPIPETVKIGPHRYRVALVEDLRDPDDRNARLFGHVDTATQTIQLAAGNTPGHMVSTLLHEVIHALDFDGYAIGLSEKQTKRLGVGLAAFLLDNNLLAE
jgi:hypothetical protein